MNSYSILLLIGMSLMSGCSLFNERQPPVSPEPFPKPLTQADAANAPDEGFGEFNRRDSNGDFSKSSFVVSDFMNVVKRVPDFIPGTTRFSSALPRTRYGEILMEALRQEGFAIVLGDSENVPALRYSIELPAENSQDVHTFFISLGGLELKRSYEIVAERIAPVSDMLMAGIDPTSLRPLPSNNAARNARSIQTPVAESATSTILLDSEATADTADTAELDVPRINELVNTDEGWDPLDTNLYETGESVYEPMFADAAQKYEQINSQVLVFPNDSLVLGNANKRFLFDLADQVRQSEDVIRLVGCSHGKSQLADGNEKLAKGRAIRVREELLLAGVDESAILHEVCWANVHFDEQFPRRGVVVMHLRPAG